MTLRIKAKPILLIVVVLLLAAGAVLIWYSLAGDPARSAPSESAKQPKPLLVEVKPVLRGEMPLFVNADDYGQIEQAIHFARQNSLQMVLMGSKDAWH